MLHLGVSVCTSIVQPSCLPAKACAAPVRLCSQGLLTCTWVCPPTRSFVMHLDVSTCVRELLCCTKARLSKIAFVLPWTCVFTRAGAAPGGACMGVYGILSVCFSKQFCCFFVVSETSKLTCIFSREVNRNRLSFGLSWFKLSFSLSRFENSISCCAGYSTVHAL